MENKDWERKLDYVKGLSDDQLDQKCDELNESLFAAETRQGTLIAYLLLFGFLSLGGGIVNILQNGVNVINGAAVLLGASTSYYWRERDRKKKYNLELLAELRQEKSRRSRKSIREILQDN